MKSLFFATLLGLGAINHALAQTPQQIVQSFYPTYSDHFQCRIAQHDEASYCMKLVKTETRQTKQGKLMYLAFSGQLVDLKELKELSYHVSSGLVGVFVLKEADDGWQLLSALPTETVGAFGSAPSAERWSFWQLGADKWGFLTTHFDVHQGHAGSHYVLFHHDGGRQWGVSWIGASIDDSGAYGDDCELRNETPKEKRECLQRYRSADTSFAVAKNTPADHGFLPIKISVSGVIDQKRYRNQNYLIRYDAKKGQYIEPRNYPLADIDY